MEKRTIIVIAVVAILAVGGYCGWLGSGTEGEGRDTANIDLPAVQRGLIQAVAATAATPAISYGLGQGATMVAAVWGVFVWREFREAPILVTHRHGDFAPPDGAFYVYLRRRR